MAPSLPVARALCHVYECAVLALTDVTFCYPGAAEPILSDVTLAVGSKEIVGILGPNGVGKSTLIRIGAGVLRPEHGDVRAGGERLSSLSRADIARKIAVLSQREDVAFEFSAWDLVVLGRAPYAGVFGWISDVDRREVEAALRACGAWGFRDRNFSTLSGGEQKRVALARAFAQSSSVLLLDEPTSSLDVRHQIAMLDLVAERTKRRGLATVMVLHDLNLATQYCDRVVLLEKGGRSVVGIPDEVLTEERVREAFGADMHVGRAGPSATRFFVPKRG